MLKKLANDDTLQKWNVRSCIEDAGEKTGDEKDEAVSEKLTKEND
jgi:hypothetical protein